MRALLSIPLWCAWLICAPFVVLFAALNVVCRPHDCDREYRR
jgi:hypothetical protein